LERHETRRNRLTRHRARNPEEVIVSKSDQEDEPGSSDVSSSETQQIWTTPAIQRISAGMAEFNNRHSTDLNNLS
jgi:hypothetical protein